MLPPPLKATVPVGVPDAEDTVAVNVSVWPGDVGLGDTFSDVDVAVLGGDSMSSVADPELEA